MPPPDMANVSYGPHKLNTLDLWKAKSEKPTPLLVVIHGGGFSGGDKSVGLNWAGINPPAFRRLLQAGISVATINYRLAPEVIYPVPMMDGARAVQFLRSKAKEWNLDPARFAATGDSAGGGISLWLAFHDDLADAKSEDPVAQQSTRLTCVAPVNAQTSYDRRFFKERLNGEGTLAQQLMGLTGEQGLNPPPEKAKLMEDASPINHLTADDPPVFLRYGGSVKHTPVGVHTALFGKVLKEKMDELKIECIFQSDDPENRKGGDQITFLIRHLAAK